MTAIRLRTYQAALEAALSEIEQRTHEVVITQEHDPVDNARDASERDREARIADVDRRKVRAIRAALQNIRLGLYGICSECYADISEKRLDAVPFATRCSTCQAVEEEQQAAEAVA